MQAGPSGVLQYMYEHLIFEVQLIRVRMRLTVVFGNLSRRDSKTPAPVAIQTQGECCSQVYIVLTFQKSIYIVSIIGAVSIVAIQQERWHNHSNSCWLSEALKYKAPIP